MALAEPHCTATQRLFFALWPNTVTRDALVQAQARLAAGGGQPLHAQDLHITLAFLGQVAVSRLPCVQASAEGVQAAPFVISLTQQGSWPGPKIAWIAPERPPPALQDLVDQLWQGLATCGFTPETRPYRPHVTLRRKGIMIKDTTLPAAVRWEAHDFVLAASLSGAHTPRYNVLHRWPLGGDVL